MYPFKRISDKNFWKYASIGIVSIILTTFILWVLVDLLGFLALYANPLVSLLIFFAKFSSYNKINLFDKKKGLFWKYVAIHVFVIAIATALLWMSVDIWNFSVIIMNPLVVVFSFLIRFELFDIFGLVKRD